MQIHRRLKTGGYPNSTHLARQFEVHKRTIKRDLDFMKFRLNLPIEYDARRNGFYYAQAVEQFPPFAITEAEIFALLVAHQAISQYHGTPFQKPLETAFRKLSGQLDQESRYSLRGIDELLSFRPLAPEDSDLRNFRVLTAALQQRRAIRFRYKNLGARQPQDRRAHPYHLACIDSHWYLFAFDVDRQAMRTFALSRLSLPRLTAEKFKRPRHFRPDDYLKGSFSVFKGGDDYEVVVDFDGWATDLIRGRRWHPSQEFTELPDGCSRLRLRLSSIEEMEQWVLGWGRHATVVRPRALIERLRQTAAVLLDKYPATPAPV
mgnify:CR=1 FL=1